MNIDDTLRPHTPRAANQLNQIGESSKGNYVAAVRALAPGLPTGFALEISDLLDQVSADVRNGPEPAERPESALSFDPVAMQGATVAAKTRSTRDDCNRRFDSPICGGEIPADIDHIVGSIQQRAERPEDILEGFASRLLDLQPTLNYLITDSLGDARRAARAPRPGKLTGVPFVLKDLIDTAGIRTTYGSRVYADHVPTKDAKCWEKLRNSGAILLGKANTQEFAAGVTSENDEFGHVLNPWDTSCVSGGSSGGSAAAVAVGGAAAALGTDTGGSVRIPAALCGVVGFKPSFGSVPTAGVRGLAWTLDHIGPIGRSVVDVARIYDVLSDGTECEAAALAGAAQGLENVRVHIPWSWLDSGVEPDVYEGFLRCLEIFERAGSNIRCWEDVPSSDVLTAANRIIAYSEGTFSNRDILDSLADVGPLVRARMAAGRFMLVDDYFEAQSVRSMWCSHLGRSWIDNDVLILPTVPCSAPAVGSKAVKLGPRSVPLGLALAQFTAPFNLSGSPAISVPLFGYGKNGLPLSIQIVGPVGTDENVCRVAAAFEMLERCAAGSDDRRGVPRIVDDLL